MASLVITVVILISFTLIRKRKKKTKIVPHLPVLATKIKNESRLNLFIVVLT